MSVHPNIVLEPAAQDLADATSKPPFLYDLGPAAARKVLDDLQAAPVDKLPIDEEWITVPARRRRRARADRPARRDRPARCRSIVYMHGGGWILGNAGTHDRLVRELAVGAHAAVAFVEYTPRPRHTIPSRSSRATPPPSGSPATGRHTGWTPPGWPSPASRSAAT